MAGPDDTGTRPSFMQATRASSSRSADTPGLSPTSPRGSSKRADAGNNAPTTKANLHANEAAVPRDAASADVVFSPKTVVPSGASTVADLAAKEPAAAAATADVKLYALRARQYLRFQDAHKDSSDEDVVKIKKSVEDMDPGMKSLRKLAMMGGGAVEMEERWPASWDKSRHSYLKGTITRDFSRWMACVPSGNEEAAPGPEAEAEPVEKPAAEKPAEEEEPLEHPASWASNVNALLGLGNLSLNIDNNSNNDNKKPARPLHETAAIDLTTNTRPGRTEVAVDVSMAPAMIYNAPAGPEDGYPADGDLVWWDWYRQEHAKRRAAEKASRLLDTAGS